MIRILMASVAFGTVMASPSLAATVLNWGDNNVVIGATPADGETGASVVYDQDLAKDGSVPDGASSTGKIAFTPPEAVSPGVEVSNVPYADSGTGSPPSILDGCIKTSSAAACDGPFQSGKRIKQVMTGTEPMDLVFDIDTSKPETSTYQVYGRLINQTGDTLDGFKVELGYGVGDDFVAAPVDGNLTFSTSFTAQPSGSGSSNTQSPFGLFGDAETNRNFLLDGFFDDERTGLEVEQTATTITSTDPYGAYEEIFGPWMTLDEATLPVGLFWDFDDNEETEDLLMAWEKSPSLWELRRDAGETCDATDPTNCAQGVTRDDYATGTLDEIMALLGLDEASLGTGVIEDLANMNLNYAIALGNLGEDFASGFLDYLPSSFTLRTTVMASGNPVAPVPLPAGAPLLLAGLGLLGFMRRNKATASA